MFNTHAWSGSLSPRGEVRQHEAEYEKPIEHPGSEKDERNLTGGIGENNLQVLDMDEMIDEALCCSL